MGALRLDRAGRRVVVPVTAPRQVWFTALAPVCTRQYVKLADQSDDLAVVPTVSTDPEMLGCAWAVHGDLVSS